MFEHRMAFLLWGLLARVTDVQVGIGQKALFALQRTEGEGHILIVNSIVARLNLHSAPWVFDKIISTLDPVISHGYQLLTSYAA